MNGIIFMTGEPSARRLALLSAARERRRVMSVVQFPVAQVEELIRRDRLPVVCDAVAHIERVMVMYSETRGCNPETILRMIAAILDDPELREAAGLQRDPHIRQ
jgi:hypothetical protein